MWPATREIDIPRLVLARPRRPSIGFLNPAPSADARLPSKVRRMSRARSPSRGSPPLTQHLAPQPEGRMTGEPDFEVKCGPVVLPVAPIRPITWPALTRSPTCTCWADWWAYQDCTPLQCWILVRLP